MQTMTTTFQHFVQDIMMVAQMVGMDITVEAY